MGVDLPASLMVDYVAQLQPGAIVTSGLSTGSFWLGTRGYPTWSDYGSA